MFTLTPRAYGAFSPRPQPAWKYKIGWKVKKTMMTNNILTQIQDRLSQNLFRLVQRGLWAFLAPTRSLMDAQVSYFALSAAETSYHHGVAFHCYAVRTSPVRSNHGNVDMWLLLLGIY